MANLREIPVDTLRGSRSARMLAGIRRSMDLTKVVFDRRRRNEEILELSYLDGLMTGTDARSLEENALNLPYRYARWIQAQATSKEVIVDVGRDAGAGQVKGGPADDVTGKWQAIALRRAAMTGGFVRETDAMLAEMLPLGVSVIRVGFHSQAISASDVREVGKDAQSVVGDVITDGDTEAKPGQAHTEIVEGLKTAASNPVFQAAAGTEGVLAVLDRAKSHVDAQHDQEAEAEDTPIVDSRLTRHRLWMRKVRVGEQVGWAPNVSDTEDTGFWWERILYTVREVTRLPQLFSKAFREKVKGYDGRNVSGVAAGGQTPSTEGMSSDGRQAQTEEVLDDDEKIVEIFQCWIRRPDILSGGVVKRLCPEFPDEWVEADDENPHVFPPGHPHAGQNAIPGFFPFVDFAPILGSRMVAERTLGVPPIAVGMPHFEKLVEYNRILKESGLRHSLRLYQIHPSVKDMKKVMEALRIGVDGYSFICPAELVDSNGQMHPAILPIQFSGNTMEVDRLAAREEGLWVKVMGMPPAILQGVGTAETATQDNIGIAAGERESGSIVGYCERRMADVFVILRALMRICYDDNDFVEMLGQEGAAVMKAWQTGSIDDGDEIRVTFGATAQAERMARTKQIMEAITLLAQQIDPVTGLPKYDFTALLDELMRQLSVGGLKQDAGTMAELQKLALIGKQAMAMMQQAQGGSGGGPPSQGGGGPPGAAPEGSQVPAEAASGSV